MCSIYYYLVIYRHPYRSVGAHGDVPSEVCDLGQA